MSYGTMQSRAKIHMGEVQSTTLRNPGWYTASPRTTDAKIHTMRDSLRWSV